jgi:hypothetical protein
MTPTSSLPSLTGLLTALGLSLLSGCVSPPSGSATSDKPPQIVVSPASAPAVAPDPAPLGTPTAGESALAQGVKSYQAGKYQTAETQLRLALKEGLTAPADQASAHKHLAFIYCTSKREAQCLAAFKAARAADPIFALSKTEAGHPLWAQAYKKAMAEPAKGKPGKTGK